MPQFDDDLFLGPALAGGGSVSFSPTRMDRGVGPLGRIYIFDAGTPATLSATAICAAQAVAGAGNLTINGTLAGAGVGSLAGQTVATLVEPRGLQMVSTNAGDTSQTVTVFGVDQYGQSMSQIKTLNGVTAVNFTKCFKIVTRCAVSAATTGNVSVGNRDAFGFPVAVSDIGYITHTGWAAALADDAGTVTVADSTSPATTSTTDVRGFYVPSSAANGSRRLVIGIALTALQCGPNATRVGAFGVTQA
jgi:hypothetical protein